jgi:hypothetical protein
MLPVLRRTTDRQTVARTAAYKRCYGSSQKKKRKKEERDAMASAAFDSLIKIQVGDGQTV